VNTVPIFTAFRRLKRILTKEPLAALTAQDVRDIDEAIQSAVGGHVAPSGVQTRSGTLSLRHGHPDGPEGDDKP